VQCLVSHGRRPDMQLMNIVVGGVIPSLLYTNIATDYILQGWMKLWMGTTCVTGPWQCVDMCSASGNEATLSLLLYISLSVSFYFTLSSSFLARVLFCLSVSVYILLCLSVCTSVVKLLCISRLPFVVSDVYGWHRQSLPEPDVAAALYPVYTIKQSSSKHRASIELARPAN